MQSERPKKILIMDDEPNLLEIMQEMLSRNGYEVVITMEWQEAVEAYQKAHRSNSPIDLVILDLQERNDQAGILALQQMRNVHPKVKAILCSGWMFHPVMDQYEHYGFQAALTKPFGMQELLKILEEIL